MDETLAQLLVSEGFATLEEVAFVQPEEISSIDGFDAETAEELQARARECLEEINSKSMSRAKELGLEEDLENFKGLTPPMFEVLAEDGIKSLKDFATCADWELAGGYTTIDGKRVKDDGLLEKFDVSLQEARILVMTARHQIGLITEEDLQNEINALENKEVKNSD